MITYSLCVGNEEMDFFFFFLNDLNNLKKIDIFTSRFKNVSELKKYLISKKMLRENNDYKTYIEYFYRHIRRLDVIYEEHTSFVAPLNLEASYYKIQDFIVTYFDNKEFLKKLYSYLKAHANSNAYIVRNCISGVEVDYNEKSQIVSDICESIMVKYMDGKRIYNYKALRDLGMFMFNYEKTQKLEQQKKEEKPLFVPYSGEQLTFFKK